MRGSPHSPVVRFKADTLIGRPASFGKTREFEQEIMEHYQAGYMVGGTLMGCIESD